MKEEVCPVCDKVFYHCQQKQVCCSSSCSNRHRVRHKPKRYCDFCSKEITSRPRAWIRHKTCFCNKECEGKFKTNRITINCSVCNKQVESVLSKKRTVCSKECMKIHLRRSYKTRKVTRVSFTEVFLVFMLKKNFSNLKIIENDREILDGFEIDIFLPEFKIGVECSGVHHFLPVNGEGNLAKVQKRDKMKRGLAFKKGIKIITLKYLMSHSKTTKTKLINLFLELCAELDFTPSILEVSMKEVDNLYRILNSKKVSD